MLFRSVTVSPSTVAWTAASSQAWLTLSAGSGTGSGSVTLTAAETTSAFARTATVTIGGQTVTVTQAAGTNAFSLSSATWAPVAGGASTALAVTAPYSDAPWTATSDQAWLTLSAASGTGDGTVTLTAASTTSLSTRAEIGRAHV